MDEIISSMKLIKMYCWENQFAKRISKARNEEIRVIRFANCPRRWNTKFHPNVINFYRKVALFRALMLTIEWSGITIAIFSMMESLFNILGVIVIT